MAQIQFNFKMEWSGILLKCYQFCLQCDPSSIPFIFCEILSSIFRLTFFAFYGHVPFDTYLIVKKCKMLGNFDKVLNCKPNTVPDWQFCIFRELLSVKWHDIMTFSQDDGNFICVDIRFRLYIYAYKKISDFAIFDANRLWLSIFVSWNRNHVIT